MLSYHQWDPVSITWEQCHEWHLLPSITKVSLKTSYLKFHWYLPGANDELILMAQHKRWVFSKHYLSVLVHDCAISSTLEMGLAQNKISNLPDRRTLLPKFIYDEEGKLAGPSQILRVRFPRSSTYFEAVSTILHLSIQPPSHYLHQCWPKLFDATWRHMEQSVKDVLVFDCVSENVWSISLSVSVKIFGQVGWNTEKLQWM